MFTFIRKSFEQQAGTRERKKNGNCQLRGYNVERLLTVVATGIHFPFVDHLNLIEK